MKNNTQRKSQKINPLPNRRGSLNDAATGIFQPSENPSPVHVPKAARRAGRVIDRLETEVSVHQDFGPARQGQVEQPGDGSPSDTVVGPDIGTRPHRPKIRATR